MGLSNEQIIDYLHRSYTAVDGLWFEKVEEEYGFEEALKIDEKVWYVLPKIQARKLKSMTGLSSGIDDLYECFTTKLGIDRIVFSSSKDEEGFTIRITECPWLKLLCNANREHLAGEIGSRICTAEYSTWAKEFGSEIRYELQSQLCKGGECCELRFFTSSSHE